MRHHDQGALDFISHLIHRRWCYLVGSIYAIGDDLLCFSLPTTFFSYRQTFSWPSSACDARRVSRFTLFISVITTYSLRSRHGQFVLCSCLPLTERIFDNTAFASTIRIERRAPCWFLALAAYSTL